MPEHISPQTWLSGHSAERRSAVDPRFPSDNDDARRSARVRVVAIVVTTFLILLILISLVVDILSARDIAIAGAERTTQSLARVMDEQTANSIDAIDVALAAAAAAVRPPSRGKQLDQTTVAEVLREADRSLPVVRGLWITDTNGDTIHASDNREQLSDREYFRVQRDNSRQGLYVGGPVLSDHGSWFIILSRRIDDAGGRFAGVAAAALDTHHLQRFYESLDFGKEGAVALLHREGRLIVRAPATERAVGQKLNPPPPFITMLPHAASATYRAVSAIDHVPRIYSYRSVRGSPLVVLVGLGERESLIGWRKHAQVDALTAFAFVLAIASLGYLLVRELRRRDALSEALAFDIAERKTAEADRLALQERDHALVRALGQIIYEWLPSQDQISWEGDYARVLGYSAAEIGQDIASWTGRLHPEDRNGAFAELEASTRERRIYDHEYRLRHRDGHYVWVHARAVPSVTADGQLIRFIGVVIDVSTRKQAEADQLALQQRAHALARALGQIVYDWQPLADKLSWEGDYTRVLGYSAAEIGTDTTSWANRLHPEDVEGTWAELDASIREHRIYDHEYRLRHRDGHYVWLHDRAVTFMNADGQLIQLIGVMADISARKQAEADRLALQERDHALAQALGQIIYDWLPRVNKVSWEGDYTRVLGYSAAEIGHDAVSWSSRVHPDDLSGAVAETEASIHEHRIYDREYRLRHRDGHYVWIHDRAVPLVSADGQLIRLIGVMIDVSARKKAEQELKDHAERLQDLSKRLMEVEESERRRINQELHDRIGQSLSTLSLNLTLLRARLPEFSAGELGNQIDEEQKLLESTIVQVRNVMADLHPPALEEFGLRAALRIFSTSFSARVGIPITVRGADLTPRPPPAVELCLFRVAQEALANSAKHAHARHIDVILAQSGDSVTLTVSDDGAGFDTRRRAEVSYGLTIMHERAEAAGIELDIESAPGRGTRVIARTLGTPVG